MLIKEQQMCEDKYRRFFEHANCGLFISSKEGYFIDVNQALVDILGYDTKEELLKIDITHDLYLKPEDRQKFIEIIDRDESVNNYEVMFKRKDQTPVAILLAAIVRRAADGRIIGYQGINVDHSQKKQEELEFEEAHDFQNNIIQSSPNPIMGVDLKGNIIIWNQAAEEALSYKSEDVIGKMNIAEIYPRNMAQKVMKMMRSPEYGGVGKLRSYPMVFVRKDGGKADGNLSAAIIYDTKGEEVASVGIFVDLEERIAMERKLRNVQQQLLQSEKLSAMGRLTSQIAHELNNPLYGIMNTLELLKTEIGPENKRRKILDMALSETMRLTDMLRKTLSFSKPDQELRQPANVNDILDGILLLYEKQLREHNIHIKSSLDESLGPVNASNNQLRQVFLNLVANARDAMPDGGILNVATQGDDRYMYVKISDTGIGIREENLDKIFDTFFTTKKDSVKGVGLGLSVCYGFIKDHGGDIQVESNRGEGTAFTVSLPFAHETN